jgi:hypothetical protein
MSPLELTSFHFNLLQKTTYARFFVKKKKLLYKSKTLFILPFFQKAGARSKSPFEFSGPFNSYEAHPHLLLIVSTFFLMSTILGDKLGRKGALVIENFSFLFGELFVR